MLIYPGRTDSATFTAVHFLRPDNTQITLTSKVDLLTSVISGDIRLATPLRVGDSGTWALARDCEAFRGLVARGERYKTRYLAYFALNVVLFGGLFAFTLTAELSRLVTLTQYSGLQVLTKFRRSPGFAGVAVEV